MRSMLERTYARKPEIWEESEGGSDSIISPWAILSSPCKTGKTFLLSPVAARKTKEKSSFDSYGLQGTVLPLQGDLHLKNLWRLEYKGQNWYHHVDSW